MAKNPQGKATKHYGVRGAAGQKIIRLSESRNEAKNVLNERELKKVEGLIPGSGAFVWSSPCICMGSLSVLRLQSINMHVKSIRNSK